MYVNHLFGTSIIDGLQASKDGKNSALPLLPGRKIPRTSELLPRDLAIALTLLEGDKYKCILPTDYIAHLRRQRRSNHVEAAYLTNNKIVLWVKQSVLHYDAIESRVQVLKFFINTAQVYYNFPLLPCSRNLIDHPIYRSVGSFEILLHSLQSPMHCILPQSIDYGSQKRSSRYL